MRLKLRWLAVWATMLTLVGTYQSSAWGQEGPYSGVTLDSLLDTPIRGHNAVVEASGADILAYGANMSVGEVDGYQSAVTEDGFYLEVTAQLDAGVTSLMIEVTAPTKGSDSYHVWVDGQQQDFIVLPYQHFGTVSVTFELATSGQHTFRLEHREGPGSAIRRFTLGGQVWSSLPAMLPALASEHPRMYLTSADLAGLQQRLTDPRVEEYYRLPGLLDESPPAYQPGARNGGAFRHLARYALGHLLEPDPDQLAAVLDWLTMATTYGDVGADLDAEYFLEGVALSYDWLYHEIPQPLRDQVRDLIAEKTRHVFAASLDGRQGGWLHFQQNHYWYANFAIALGATAVYGEVPEAEPWLWWAWDRFERMQLSFSPDGSFHEGPAYWDFSMPVMYLFTDLYEQQTGLPIAAGDDGLQGQGQFRFHYLYPGLESTAAMEDTQTKAGRPPLRLHLWEAKRFQDPLTMGLADVLNQGASSLHFHLLWLDEQLSSAAALEQLPLGRHYQDVGTAFARSSWEQDATYFAFVSRPLGGHKWAELCDQYGLGGTGHNHPAQNHFVLYARGEVLAGDPGYTYDKKTRNHNTVLVDGQGQYGDGEMWPGPTPGRSQVTDFVNEGDISIVGGDASTAYPEELSMTSFHRWMVMAGADLVVTHDRLAASEPRTFSWLLHHGSQLSEEQGRFTLTRNQAQLTVVPISPADAASSTETYLPNYIHPTKDLTPEEPEVNLLQLDAGPATDATFLVPLLVGAAGAEAAPVTDLSEADFDGIQVDDTVVAFNRTDGEITVPLPWGETLTTDAQVIVARVNDGEQQIVTAPESSSGSGGAGGAGGSGGSGPGQTVAGDEDDGCGCRLVASRRGQGALAVALALLAAAGWRRRRDA